MRTTLLALAALAALAVVAAAPSRAADIFIVNVDGPNEGFNDPTPATPVGGNPGTTLGQQRLVAFQYAADLWGSILPSDAPIFVQASFDPLACTATSGTLGAAGATQVFANSPGVEVPGLWYHVALADKLAAIDLSPGIPDLVAFFNADLDNPVCLGPRGWYYGLDNNHGNDIDLVVVLLHELGHGLGFANFVNEAAGTFLAGRPDIYAFYTKDESTGKWWDEMSQAELLASAVNSRNVTWGGVNVTAAVPSTLAPGVPILEVTSPASAAGFYAIGAAAFGPPLSSPGISGSVVQALDPANAGGPSTTDACSPLTNAAAVAGNIALVDRGTCGFTIKVKNAQDAGAIAVIVADNAPGSPPGGLGGTDPTITIPSARITLADGNVIKASLASGVTATLGVDLSLLAGAHPASGWALLNAPNPVQSGSSISHWDPIATPNLLMEPAINADLTHGVDLTLQQMTDIGWFSDGDGVPDGMDACIGSDPNVTVVIDGCDSGVPNTVFQDGCRISDHVEDCAGSAANHGGFASCVTDLGDALRRAGVITGKQKGALQSCAAQASLP